MLFGIAEVSRSLYALLAGVICLVVLTIVGLQATWFYHAHEARIRDDIGQEAQANLASLRRNLAPFIESFAVNEYAKMVANEIELRPHFAIVVSDANMGRLLGQDAYLSGKIQDGNAVVDFDPQDPQQLAQLDSSFHVARAPIVSADGETLGSVAIYTNDDAMRLELRRLLMADVLGAMVVALLMIALLLLTVRRVVVRPLQRIADGLGAADADGIPHAPLPSFAFREIRVLTDAMNTMLDEIRVARDKLHQSAGVFEHANEGIMITDADGDILDVNAAFSRITGYARDEILGQNPRILNSGRHDAAFYAAMWRNLRAHGAWTNEVWNRRKNGEIFPQMQTVSSVKDESGKPVRYISLFSDISELKRQQHQLEHLAHYDALTHLPNRVLLADRLQQVMINAVRRETLVGVVFLDLDNFKVINDTHGHALGDEFLVKVSQRMREVMREGDTLSRLGGDEFVAVFQDLHCHEDCQPFVQRLLKAVSDPVVIDSVEFRVSASVGIAFFPQSEKIDPDQLLRQADQAMYQAKQTGKNRYHVFDAEYDRAERGHHESRERIREGLEQGEFELFYQPKVNMRRGDIFGAEALIRWRHPERGLLSPAAFLPLVNGHVLSIEIGKWVIESALTQMEEWTAHGFRLPVSVNIEAIQLQQSDFIDDLRQTLARHPAIRPGDLEMEVLETAALDDIAQVSDVIGACQRLGVTFALDDFGTGYSSLTYLKRLPAQVLKIDQSFVRNMLDDPDDLGILFGVLGLASSFGRRAIAEGVETNAHVEMLLRIGCELGQGYAIARPMPAREIMAWAASWQPEAAWQSCAAVTRDEQPMLMAIIEHRAWVVALKRALADDAWPVPVIAVDACRFSQLIDKHGARQGGARTPGMERVIALHGAVHALAAELLAVKAQHGAGQALDRFGEIESMLDQLQRLMFEVIETASHDRRALMTA